MDIKLIFKKLFFMLCFTCAASTVPLDAMSNQTFNHAALQSNIPTIHTPKNWFSQIGKYTSKPLALAHRFCVQRPRLVIGGAACLTIILGLGTLYLTQNTIFNRLASYSWTRNFVEKLVDLNLINVPKILGTCSSPLGRAIETNNLDRVIYLVEKCEVDVNQNFTVATEHGDCSEKNPRKYALEKGNSKIIRYLFKDLNKPTKIDNLCNGLNTPLTWAIKNKKSTLIKVLVEELKVDVNQSDENQSPLGYALENSDQEILSYLAEKDADINMVCSGSSLQTPLTWCISKRMFKLATFIVEKLHADINLTDQSYQKCTPLGAVLDAFNQDNQDISALTKFFMLLINKKVNVNQPCRGGYTPLYLAIKNNLGNDIIKILVEQGAVINTPGYDWGCTTPLQLAVENNKLEIVKILIENTKNFDINAKDKLKLSIISYALKDSTLEILKYLVSKGAQASDEHRIDALIKNQKQVVKYLETLPQ